LVGHGEEGGEGHGGGEAEELGHGVEKPVCVLRSAVVAG
jgi:hypothetical protein